MTPALRQYAVITGNYWAFTLTDGALRMLVVLYFYQLGYEPLQIAMLFVFYELFGVITNLIGGWLGARIGLNRTMNLGLALQIGALSMLAVPSHDLSVFWVMAAQALSGVAKDLNKMSAKSAIKMLLPSQAEGILFKWVSVLTGSKNALKGAGFFLGGSLLAHFGFQTAILLMACVLFIVWCLSLTLLRKDLGKARQTPKFTDIFSKSDAVNYLSAARFFLFGARDIWFVIALPVFLSQTLNWGSEQTSAFLALWVIGYGIIQALSPRLLNYKTQAPTGDTAKILAGLLVLLPASIGLGLLYSINPTIVVIVGLTLFAFIFALNSAVHSFLIVDYAKADGVSLDVGFYYMANAMGRLVGTVLSGLLFQMAGQSTLGLIACLIGASLMLGVTFIISFKLPKALA